MLKFLQARLKQYVNWELPDYKRGFKKAEEQEDTLSTFTGWWRKQSSPRKTSTFSFINDSKAFGCVDHNKLWKVLKEMGIPDYLTCLLKSQEAKLELDMKQQTGSKSRKEYIKDVYCHPAYLTYMQSTSGEGNGTPLQYSCLENPMEGGAW